MTDWSQPQPVGDTVALEGHVPFTYVLTDLEIYYLKEHGFERSVVTPETRWVRQLRMESEPVSATVEITPRGVVLKITRGRGPNGAKNRRFSSYSGLQLIPLLVRAQLAGEL